MAEKTIQLESIDTIISLFGNFDENAKLIEKELNIRMFNRDSMVKIEGEPHDVDRGEKTIRSLIQLILKGEPLTTQNILYHYGSFAYGIRIFSKYFKKKKKY